MPAELEPAWPCWRMLADKHVDWDAMSRMSIDDVDLLDMSIRLLAENANDDSRPQMDASYEEG